MKINNKGFTFIEILAAILILSILLVMGTRELIKHIRNATIQSYDTMAASASNATEEYLMDHPTATEVNFDELVFGNYLENTHDPADDDKSCTGTVTVAKNKGGAGALDKNEYTVSMCCKEYNYTYVFPGGNKVEDKEGCKAALNTVRLIETVPENCEDGKTAKMTYNVYTMDYIDSVCEKGSNGRYGACYDEPEKVNSNNNLPCRRYRYHQRGCECTYSQVSNKFCSSKLTSSKDDHTMKIRYFDNEDGIDACKSPDPAYINSYVDHVCMYGGVGSVGKNKIAFHGYEFYSGKSQDYQDFKPNGSWFHDGGYYDERVPRGSDVNGQPDYEDGCKKTCIYFTERWQGPVSD